MSRLYLLSLFFIPLISTAQSTSIGMQVLASAGGSGAQGNFDVSWTIGEPVIYTLRNQDFIVSQGFHQPDIFAAVSTWDPALAAMRIRVFPNPTADVLHLQYHQEQDIRLEWIAWDAFGKLISGPFPANPDDTVIDCSNWPSGVYFLNLRAPGTHNAAIVRFIRL